MADLLWKWEKGRPKPTMISGNWKRKLQILAKFSMTAIPIITINLYKGIRSALPAKYADIFGKFLQLC